MKNKNDLIRLRVRDSGWSADVIIEAEGGIYWLTKSNIKTLEHDSCVSWHYHDVFKKINYVYWNGCNEYPRFYLEESKLYNKTKLKGLKNKKAFKNRDYSFFFYGEVERVLGMKVTEEGMSGLFKRGRK